MKSWRTTTIGILGVIVGLAQLVYNFLDNDPNTLFTMEQLIAIIGGAGFVAAKDETKT